MIKKMGMIKVIELFCISLIFISCNLKKDDLRINELVENNSQLIEEKDSLITQINELENKINELENVNTSLLIEIRRLSTVNIDFSNTEKYEVHDLTYSLFFEYGGFNTKVYENPSTEKEIYIIQKNDKIDISKVIYEKEAKENFIEVMIGNGLKGYIKIRGNPYENGNFEYIETLCIDEKEITILKMEDYFHVSDGTSIKELPFENGEALHEITHEEGFEGYKSLAITLDYKWVKIQFGSITGWVSVDSLSVNRGGPTLDTPENYIEFDLIDSNLI